MPLDADRAVPGHAGNFDPSINSPSPGAAKQDRVQGTNDLHLGLLTLPNGVHNRRRGAHFLERPPASLDRRGVLAANPGVRAVVVGGVAAEDLAVLAGDVQAEIGPEIILSVSDPGLDDRDPD